MKANIPESIVPQPPDEDEEEVEIPSGTFGMPGNENHNAYEVNVCPYTTMRFLELAALEEPQAEWIPLPANLMSQGGVATNDFLGYSCRGRVKSSVMVIVILSYNCIPVKLAIRLKMFLKTAVKVKTKIINE